MAAKRQSSDSPGASRRRGRTLSGAPEAGGTGPAGSGAAGAGASGTGATGIGASGIGATGSVPLELDTLIHERARLGIVSALAVNDTLTFNDLKGLLGVTDGNLSVHARKLEEAGYITCTKYFEGRLPRTEFRLTTKGKGALERYLTQMESLIRRTRNG